MNGIGEESLTQPSKVSLIYAAIGFISSFL